MGALQRLNVGTSARHDAHSALGKGRMEAWTEERPVRQGGWIVLFEFGHCVVDVSDRKQQWLLHGWWVRLA